MDGIAAASGGWPTDIWGPLWTGVNNLANFEPLPRDIIAYFIRNGAETFHRPWLLLVNGARPGDWLDQFLSSYRLTDEREFGGYTVYRLVPK